MSDDQNSAFDVQKLKSQAETKIKELWSGSIPLFETFWIYYFAVVVVLQIVGQAFGVLGMVLSLAALAWAGFMVKPIWLAADKYAGPKHWAALAKIVAILIVIGVISSLL